METAKRTDLPDLLEHLGYTVRRLGSRYHTTREMDSICIKERRTWKRYSNGTGGDAISSSQSPLNSVSACGENCVRSLAPPLPTKSSILRGPQRQEFCGKDFREAVNYLLEFNGGRAASERSPLNSVSAYGKNSVHSRAPPSPIEPASMGTLKPPSPTPSLPRRRKNLSSPCPSPM